MSSVRPFSRRTDSFDAAISRRASCTRPCSSISFAAQSEFSDWGRGGGGASGAIRTKLAPPEQECVLLCSMYLAALPFLLSRVGRRGLAPELIELGAQQAQREVVKNVKPLEERNVCVSIGAAGRRAVPWAGLRACRVAAGLRMKPSLKPGDEVSQIPLLPMMAPRSQTSKHSWLQATQQLISQVCRVSAQAPSQGLELAKRLHHRAWAGR